MVYSQTGSGGGGVGWKEREDIEGKIFLLNVHSPAESTLNNLQQTTPLWHITFSITDTTLSRKTA